MILLESHPELAAKDCEECKKYAYDMKTGKIIMRPDGTKEPRAPGTLNCPMCPKFEVEDLTIENYYAYVRYVTCSKLGVLPASGGLEAQDPYLVRKFEILAMIDRQRDLAFASAKLSMPMM